MATVSKYTTSKGETLYRVRYRTPDQKQTDKRGFATKRDADAFAATVEVAKMRGEYVAPSVGRITVGELGTDWLARQTHIKPSSYRTYESGYRLHVVPRWDLVPVSAVRFSDVQAWVSELTHRTEDPSTVRNVYGVLNRILEDAVRDRMIPSNPARGVKLPPKARRRQIFLTREQLDRLADESGKYDGLVLLLGIGGLRWGEAAALRVRDIEFLARRIHLHENAVTMGGKVITGTLKSGKARTVVVPQFVIDALSRTARGKSRDDLLWSTKAGNPLNPPSTSTSWLAVAVRRCQMSDPTFPTISAHALRHTAASLAISADANPKVVQRMLGHSSAAMTLDVYADLFESDLDTVAENVGKMWASGGQR